jgi:hypothetical protein
MGQDGDGAIQSNGAFAFGDQKPYEHSKGGRALFGCRQPARCAALHDKLSQGSRIQLVELQANVSEQLANVDRVIVDGAHARAALPVYPLAKGHQKSRVGNWTRDSGDFDGAVVFQVSEEEADTVQ